MAALGRLGQLAAVVVAGSALGLAIAGVPDRSRDEPLRLTPADTVPPVTEPPDVPTTTSTTSPPPTAATTATTAAVRGPGEVRVMALNASNTGGVAGRVGARLQAAGYVVVPPGPNPRRFDNAFLLYRRGFEREAVALAALLGLSPSVARPMGEQAPVPVPAGVDVTVVVGDDLARRA